MLIKYAKSIPRDGGFPQQTRIICFFFVPSCPLSGLATQRSGSPDRTLYKKNAMYHFVTSIRTCYADVDQMGFVYYGNYPKFYEIARTETIRSLGISYKEMEERGIMMPVVEINLHYKRPAHPHLCQGDTPRPQNNLLPRNLQRKRRPPQRRIRQPSLHPIG